MKYKDKIKIFVVEDDDLLSELYDEYLRTEGFTDINIFQNGTSFLQNLHQRPDIITLDYHLPDYNGIDLHEKIKLFDENIIVILISSQDDVKVVVDAYHKGIKEYIIKNRNTTANLVNAVNNFGETINLRKEVEQLKDLLVERNKYTGIIGESAAVLSAIRLLQKAEKTSILTLITGETGTGKDVFAKALHFNSPRHKKPFVSVNVTAIPDELIESELFGHEKGAFTGASSTRIGKFEEANGGSIFLDEIGDINLTMQAKLLRVLQEGKITKLGTNKEIKLDLRIIAATNKNLGKLVKNGTFRDDLFYRLQGFLIHLPPLRERENDVILLANNFLKDSCKLYNLNPKSLHISAIKRLTTHTWPGNIRELKSLIERASLVCDTDTITEDDLIFSRIAV